MGSGTQTRIPVFKIGLRRPIGTAAPQMPYIGTHKRPHAKVRIEKVLRGCVNPASEGWRAIRPAKEKPYWEIFRTVEFYDSFVKSMSLKSLNGKSEKKINFFRLSCRHFFDGLSWE